MERKRVSIKIIRPNPLFEQWLTEWQNQARQKSSKMEKCYSNALSSLKKYPLPLSSGKHCIILRGFGEKLCKMLDDRLELHRKNDGREPAEQYNSVQKDGVAGKFKYTNNCEKGTNLVQNNSEGLYEQNNSVELPIHTEYNEGGSSQRNNKQELYSSQVNCDDLLNNLENCKETFLPTKKILNDKNKGDEKVCPQTSPVINNNYTPAFRSGGYAILITLYQDSLNSNSKGYLTKEEILVEAQPFCDTSFKKSPSGGYYTAWSSMSNLIAKGMVRKNGNPARYYLTDQGINPAHKLFTNRNNTEQQSDQFELGHGSNSKVNSRDELFNNRNNPVQLTGTLSTKTSEKGKKTWKKNPSSANLCSETIEESFIIQSGMFDVLLLVDTQETSGASRKNDDPIIHELEKTRIKYEVRHLKIGDYLWIARDRESGKELVLPYIVERKRIDDFGASIKDGRFHEQKFRLKQSGLPKLIYVVENYNTRHTGLPLGTLHQAATNTLIQDGFMVKFTEQLQGTVKYLTNVTRIIVSMYKDKTLISCAKKDFRKTDLFSLVSFKEFNLAASKNKSFKVQEMFVKQLLQLKGVSVDKALSIIEAYPTPKILVQKYSECTQKEGENLLSGLQFGKLRKNIGPVISKTVYQLFNFNHY